MNATTDGPRMIQGETTLRAHVATLHEIVFGDRAKRHSTWQEEADAACSAFGELVEEVLSLRRAADAVPALTPLGEQVLSDGPGDETPADDDEIPFGTPRPPAAGAPWPNDSLSQLQRRHNRRGGALRTIQSATQTLLEGHEEDCISPAAARHFIEAIFDVCSQTLPYDGSIPSVANHPEAV